MAKEISDNLKKAEGSVKGAQEGIGEVLKMEDSGERTVTMMGVLYEINLARYYQNNEIIKLLKEIKEKYNS